MFKFVSLFFILLEISSIYDLYKYNKDGLLNISRINLDIDSQLQNVLRLYSTWIGNCKSIFVLNLIPVIFTDNKVLHFYTCNTLIAGISLYYITMEPKVKYLVQLNIFPIYEDIALSFVIGKVLLPFFVIADLCLIYELYYEPQTQA